MCVLGKKKRGKSITRVMKYGNLLKLVYIKSQMLFQNAVVWFDRCGVHALAH